MTDRERIKLLFGPYQAPALRVGDRAFCLARDSDVVITSWTAARISWPRCRTVGHHGGSGILVDEELARALRHESAVAIRYWWGAGVKTVAWWRKALGIGRADPPGSERLIQAAAEAGGAEVRGKKLPRKAVKIRQRNALALDLGKHLVPGGGRPLWTEKEVRLLGTAPDEEIAARLGRTTNAIRVKRTKLGIRTARHRPNQSESHDCRSRRGR
jgi:hypothetical protein